MSQCRNNCTCFRVWVHRFDTTCYFQCHHLLGDTFGGCLRKPSLSWVEVWNHQALLLTSLSDPWRSSPSWVKCKWPMKLFVSHSIFWKSLQTKALTITQLSVKIKSTQLWSDVSFNWSTYVRKRYVFVSSQHKGYKHQQKNQYPCLLTILLWNHPLLFDCPSLTLLFACTIILFYYWIMLKYMIITRLDSGAPVTCFISY